MSLALVARAWRGGRRRATTLATIAFGAGSLALAGCSADRNVLARVGNERITVEQFVDAGRGNELQYSGPPDSAKKLLLDDLVRRELLVQGAQRQGMFRDSLFMAYRERTEGQMMREELFRRMVPSDIPVSDAEVAEFYRWRSEESHCRLIYLMSQPQVATAMAQLRRGEEFGAVADQYNLPGLLPPAGDLGWIQPGMLLSALDLQLRTAPVGKIIGPIALPQQGWFIMRIDGRRPHPQGPLEPQRAQLSEMLRQRKSRMLAQRAIETLRTSYHVRVVAGAPQFVMEKLRTPLGSQNLRELGAPPVLTDRDRAQVVAEYDGGYVTLGDALTALESSMNRPNLSMMPAVERWVESLAIDRVTLLEAQRRGIGLEPRLQRRVREQVNNLLLDRYYTQNVSSRAGATEAEVMALYAARAGGYPKLDAVHLETATFPDSAAAAQLAGHAGHAGTFREAVAMVAPGTRVKDERIQFPTSDSTWRNLEPALTRMEANEIAGPVRTPRGWVSFRLLEKQGHVPTFAELPPVVQQQIAAQATEVKRDLVLSALTDSLRRVIGVIENRDVLRRIKWPIREVDATAPS